MTPNEILSKALVRRLIKDEYARKPRTVQITEAKICGAGSDHSDWSEGYIELTVIVPDSPTSRRRTRTYWPNEPIPFVEDTQ